ncbi:Zinc finger protein MAGPIE [Heracleum sosnowskyi]|uniref:Zinc finger protein MAGPIE n=1 Tax=Heracleum sosnowskyi TaxID=360622 RepID=A0AAD8M2R5_9APIA|nr:Zinc finger protein MAGPIE [Heracleum sosnowskyi]
MLSPEDLSSSLSGFIQEPLPNNSNPIPNPTSNPSSAKRKRNLPGTPDPDAEVIALSPTSLMATNRFVCEICNKGFQRDQNLQLHRRGHNLPWKLKQRNSKEVIRKKVYLCPEKTCVHHHPSRALGDLTGVKKHYSRKHGEKKWKCDKCSKKYAVQSDWKAHSKICGTREYKCDCGTLFSRKDSFITHRAFCDALAEETSRIPAAPNTLQLRNDLMMNMNNLQSNGSSQFSSMFGMDQTGQLNFDGQKSRLPLWLDHHNQNSFLASNSSGLTPELVQQIPNVYGLSSPALPRILKAEEEDTSGTMSSMYYNNNVNNTPNHHHEASQSHMSATALLQKAATMGSTRSNSSGMFGNSFGLMNSTMSSNVHNFDSLSQGNSRASYQGVMLMGDHHQYHNNVARASDRLMMMMGDKQMEGGMTRDFLGVGGNNNNNQNIFNSNNNNNIDHNGEMESGRLYMQQELQAKFGSMSSTMDLAGEQYSCTTTGTH